MASYFYILSGQKLGKNAPQWSILASLGKFEVGGQAVLLDRSVLIAQKSGEDMHHFESFSNNVSR